MSHFDFLSNKDKTFLLEIINSNITCQNEDDFKNNVTKLTHLFPFEYAFHSSMYKEGKFHIVNIKYPQDFLERYIEKQFFANDRVFIDANQTNESQIWNLVIKQYPYDKKFHTVYNEGKEFGLNGGITYGDNDSCGSVSFFSFAGMPDQESNRAKKIIDIVVPHLSETIRRITRPEISKKKYHITPREVEIIKWLAEDHGAKGIGKILSISESTVNNHIQNIKNKLQATKTHGIVAVALNEKIIELL